MEIKFAENLKQLRKERGVTQAQLAQIVGVSQQCVSQWEHAQIEPTLSYLWRLADFFAVSIDVLSGRTEW